MSKNLVALPGDVSAWSSLLDFFCEKFPHIERAQWHTRFAQGEIADARTQRVANASAAPRAHTRYTYMRSVANEVKIPFAERIVFQNERILVADKPHFLPVVPSGAYVTETLLARLKAATGIDALTPAHRIDRETAGLVLFTVTPSVRAAYQGLFRDRQVQKTYEAIAVFRDDLALPMTYRSRLARGEHFMQAIETQGESNAETVIELIERRDRLAKYRLSPRTGARHQLRAQLNALGMPIVNDAIYPTLQPPSQDRFASPLQLLAKSLAFVDPYTKMQHVFHSAHALHW